MADELNATPPTALSHTIRSITLAVLGAGVLSLCVNAAAQTFGPSGSPLTKLCDDCWRENSFSRRSIILLAQMHAERSDEWSVTLKPGEVAEIVLNMKEGADLSYRWWTTGGRISFEFRGKPSDARSGVTYDKARGDKSQGTLKSQFDGSHGWLWRNRTSYSISITLRTFGRYEQLVRKR